MGAVDSVPRSRESDEESDGEDWMEADKYAEWECADFMDYNGIAVAVKHVEMPLNSAEKERLMATRTNDGGQAYVSSGFTHEALVFDVLCQNGRMSKFTAELTFSGVLKRWGHHKVISRYKGSKSIGVPMNEVMRRIQTPKPYNLIFHNCKHYAAQKFKEF